MDRDDLAEVAAELALGVLTGRERAQAIMHLDSCRICREHIRRLAITEEELLQLLPGRAPPAGFATRIMDRLGLAGRHRRPPPGRLRWMLAAAVSVIAVGAGLGGWGLRGAAPASPPAASIARPALRTAALTTASHQPVGTIFLDNGSPGWLYMTVDAGSGNEAVVCQLERRDGSVVTVGSFWLTGGSGHWGSPEPLPPGTVTGARLTTADGKALATASFTSPEMRGRAAGPPGTWPEAGAQSTLANGNAAAVAAARR
jgi:hypothetical protein